MRLLFGAACTAAVLLAGPLDALAARKEKLVDRVWTHPEIASFRIERIAMLPVATYDNSLPAAKLVESHVGQALQGSGYRWISATSVRDLLRSQTGSDSLAKALHQSMLKSPRLDSLAAPELCGRLRCQALLAFRVDLWEQRQIEWDQSGKPATSVQLTAALVDSSGRLLWTAAGSQVAEGQYHDPLAGNTAGTEGGLNRANTTRPEPPSYSEVLMALLNRWAPQFPKKGAAP